MTMRISLLKVQYWIWTLLHLRLSNFVLVFVLGLIIYPPRKPNRLIFLHSLIDREQNTSTHVRETRPDFFFIFDTKTMPRIFQCVTPFLICVLFSSYFFVDPLSAFSSINFLYILILSNLNQIKIKNMILRNQKVLNKRSQLYLD